MTTACLTAVSGCRASLTRINAAAYNLANVNTEGFKSLCVVQSEQVPYGAAGSVKIDLSSGVQFSDRQGQLSECSNTDIIREMVDLTIGLQVFKANCRTIRTEESLSGWIFDIVA